MGRLGHEGLLTLARKVHATTGDRDVQRLAQLAREFTDALAVHLDDEVVAMTHLPPAQARILRRGQQRLSSAAEALVGEAARGCPGPPLTCSGRAEELVALLVLQARDERLALHDPAA